MNEDPQLNAKVLYSLEGETIHVGQPDGNPEPAIKLTGMGIQKNHAIFVT